tara:strand:+ start:25079 stop:25564 length:486 start_codon:yes stop_codon:yes gene_type:complete
LGKSLKIELNLERFEQLEELPDQVRDLFRVAVEAREAAYAPYSNFHVGAALLLANGEIIKGNNQENAAYPSGLCAERTAVYYAGANYPEVEIVMMAISAKAKDKETDVPIPPCGACRQALAEYEVKQAKPIEVYFRGGSGPILKSSSVENLLPLLFTQKFL